MQQLPIIPSVANSRVSTELSGVTYVLDIRWNARNQTWYMDLYTEDEEAIMLGVALTLGSLIGARLTNPVKPPGLFVVTDLSNKGQEAGFDDMGVRVTVNFYTFEELDEL